MRVRLKLFFISPPLLTHYTIRRIPVFFIQVTHALLQIPAWLNRAQRPLRSTAHMAVVMLVCGVTTWAEPIDWRRAEGGIPFEQTIAFSGCAPAQSVADQKAFKVAILKAQANISRTRNIEVSGEEHLRDHADVCHSAGARRVEQKLFGRLHHGGWR